MTARKSVHGLLLVLALAAMPMPGRAEPHVRNGIYAGAGYGADWGKVELAGQQQTESSGTLNLRLGWALRQNLLLGAEYMRWAKDYEYKTLDGSIPWRVTLSGMVAAVTYFPGNQGFMLRLGLGVADASVDADATSFSEAASYSPDPGLAVLLAVGYEVRLTTRFALGADFDVLYLAVSDDTFDRAYVYGINLQLNWYW
ncbi:MAG: outer membrane beta-barrel protein [Candidatus Krumholzibacteria bacterium]|nr:outer membrane beta-barrel protein [Candidatus Krumholzibacteria bacterium]MDH4336046.1 outer membrane beta-barrel protein [Candidatus Krumholzibacteria bacterium]MDH5268378.1 outer membrane beta-barrel protein [Candidatus Krumholzibacteria bacterium]MDH5627579.1 outer membrane beta-barrel protein [Candidatus Krumholzibacteria bacterium]